MTFSASRVSSISATTSNRGCCSLLLFVLVQLLFSSSRLVVVQAQAESLRRGGTIARRDLANNSNKNDGCEAQCQNPPLKDLQYFDGDDLLNVQTLQSRLKTHKEQYIAKLKGMYGADTYTAMFEPTIPVKDPLTNQTTKQSVNVGRHRIFKDPAMLPVNKKFNEDDLVDNGPAWYRMVRKYQMKLLQIQLGILEERFNAKNICLKECAAGDEGNSRNLQQASGGLYTRFTWVNGGHSASAGHGNFYRESYTAELERALQPILKEIGLEFIAKNYAMGGTESAEEVALCSNSIFGRDIDSISWDYGMTDGHNQWKMTMYFYRAARIAKLKDSLSQPGNIPHRPSLLGIHQGDDYNQVLQTFQEMGATVLGFDHRFENDVIMEAAPDMFGMSDAQIEKVPPYVQYLKCEEKVESGDPGCKDNKFNLTMCEKRKAKTSWHPGWKYHALVGNQLAMTVLAAIEDALVNMAEAQPQGGTESTEELQSRLQTQLNSLNQEEEKDYNNLLDSPIPKILEPHIERWWLEKDVITHLKDLEMESFFKDPIFCHTAILPAEIRFKGLLTENSTHTTDSIYDQTYEKAVMLNDIQSLENPGRRDDSEPVAYVDPRPEKAEQFVLGGLDGEYQDCEEHLNLDKKDFFYISSRSDWRTLILPNDAEKEYYTEYDAKNQKGYILACLAKCDWGKCPAGDIQPYFGYLRPEPRKGQQGLSEAEIKAMGKIEMVINGEKVTEASNMHSCYALKNKKGHVWQPNENGQYEIRGRISGTNDYSYLRFSSFVFL